MIQRTPSERRQVAAKEVIQETGLPRAMIARLAGVNEATVWAWLRPRGTDAARDPSSESLANLARGLREYSATLEKLAAKLDAAGRER
jgi:hypothetical protein